MNRYLLGLFAVIAALMPALAFAQEELPPPPEVPPAPVSSSVLDGLLLMSTESLLMVVAGIVLSLVSTILIRQTWASDVKAAVFFAVCLVFGVIYSLTLDEWSTTDMGRRVLLVMAAGTAFYLTFKSSLTTLTTRSDALLNRTP